MVWFEIFWAFFISNLLGYGGGPSVIPLLQEEVVNHFHWMGLAPFGEVLALANALPSPIATKMGGYIGYQLGGIAGALLALAATILPTAIAMIILYKFIHIFKSSPQVTAMTRMVRPIVAVLIGILAFQFLQGAYQSSGLLQTAVLSAGSMIALQKLKLHPALVISMALGYGALFLG